MATRSQFFAPQFNARAPMERAAYFPQQAPKSTRPSGSIHIKQVRELRISTRNVKLNLALLEAMLDNPLWPMNASERRATVQRLHAYRVELRRRGDIAKSLRQARNTGNARTTAMH